MRLLSRSRLCAWASLIALALPLGNSAATAQSTVTLHVALRSAAAPAAADKPAKNPKDASDVVVWLKPVVRDEPQPPPPPASGKVQLVQHHKSFQPHVLVVPVGTVVDFPNRDPFFHNVFSLFDGKRFDLGLYEAGATNAVKFDRVGVSFLFCNIHPEMSAVVIAVDTPYFGTSDRSGGISIANVPDGRYELRVWYERSLPADLRNLTRSVVISPSNKNLGEITVPENPGFSTAHKNKYGQDYPTPPAPAYSRP